MDTSTKAKLLITGTAGFIGFHLVNKLVKQNYEIVGLDNINDYYDVRLKYARLEKTGIRKKTIEYNRLIQSEKYDNYSFIKLDLEDKDNILKLFENNKFDYVVNLAAQAGVRYSLENPYSYIDSNIYGFLNILEGCRHFPVKHLVFASSSSVYGANKKVPFSEEDNIDHPISIYAATKKTNELMAHTYSHLFAIPMTGLRFFTVYGPWGRPDMAAFLFAKAILHSKPIKVYNYGNMKRDFTYVDDIIEGISRIIKLPPVQTIDKNLYNSNAKFEIYNIGNNSPVELKYFIETIEKIMGKQAVKNYMPIQPGYVEKTFADIERLKRKIGFTPVTPIEVGLRKFIEWFIGFSY